MQYARAQEHTLYTEMQGAMQRMHADMAEQVALLREQSSRVLHDENIVCGQLRHEVQLAASQAEMHEQRGQSAESELAAFQLQLSTWRAQAK